MSSRATHGRRAVAGTIAIGVLMASCGTSDEPIVAPAGRSPSEQIAPESTTPPTAPPATAATTSTTTTSTTTTTTTTSSTVATSTAPTTVPDLIVPTSTSTPPSSTTTSTTTTTTTLPALVPVEPIAATGEPTRAAVDPAFTATNAAFDRLARNNVGASLTVTRGGEIVLARASGTTLDGNAATSDTPMVVASVSKLVVGIAVARLDQQGLVDITEPMPWGEIGIWPGNGWSDIPIAEFLGHAAGVPVARSSWFSAGATCEEHIVGLVSSPPRGHRGTWTYSNGNYCLLGMVISARTGLPLDQAVQRLVFDPVGADGVHLTLGGLLPGDMPHPHGAGVERLSRLGGAGTMVVSTDDLALAVGRLSLDDLAIVTRGVFVDQYGFGHTGTIDGAKACTWWLDGGDTVISATIAGNSRSTGGAVCDDVIPAVATDLGIGAGRPNRSNA